MKSFSKRSRPRSGGESWQVVYIDLMTNVMVIFVILWSINQAKPVRLSDKIGDHTARMITLPGDILFPPGSTSLSIDGRSVFKKLLSDGEQTNEVLKFETEAHSKRLLVIHGHTDGDGKKEENLELGFNRALATYHEMMKYSRDISDHVVLCTHADNSAVQDIPQVTKGLSPGQLQNLKEAKAKNRRITIEDKLENSISETLSE